MWFNPCIPTVISALLVYGVDGGWYWGWTGDWHALVGPAADADTWAAWREVGKFDELRSLIWGINR